MTAKCKHCGTEYTKTKPLQVVCSLPCAIERARAKRLQTEAKKQRKENRKRRESLKTTGDYIREAQIAVNRYIRARDWGKPCISCGAMATLRYGGTVDAGHYRSTGAATHLRFNLLNIHGQCVKCNRNLSGNSVEMRKGLVQRIGAERVEELENDNRTRRYNIEDLKRLKKLMNKRARYYERRRGFER